MAERWARLPLRNEAVETALTRDDDQTGRVEHRGQEPAPPRPRRGAVRGGGRVAVRRDAEGRGGVGLRRKCRVA